MKHFYPVIIAFLLLPFQNLAQTNVSGVINSYYKVTQVIPANACVRLDNTSGLSRGDLVLIIQMKGASVATNNNSSFGSVSSLNNAGNYEINTICSVEGDLVYLFRQLASTYTVSDYVQLVRIPQYTSATVTDTLKAAPWDSATGKGGVLSFSVTNNLVLNAPLFASGKGYQGGAYLTSNNTCFNFFPADNYYYNANFLSPQDGASKGEGVATLSTNYSGGKGAAANGAGGGNNHNNGGGGGANLVAGGMGGGNSSAAGCTVSNPGRGGYALSNNSGLKIYMGGGGGAGHANSGFFSTGGGEGGGIIIFHANNLISNGQKILANGVAGGNTIGDGASGGGAGGTVILDVANYSDALNVEAKGGNGGTEDDDATSQRCYGEGGGGSGGAIYFSTAVPPGTINVNGGSKGNRINSLDCAAIVAATNGTNGITTANYHFTLSGVVSTYCGAILDVQLLEFNVKSRGVNVMIDWQLSHAEDISHTMLERKKDGGSWESIYSVPVAPTLQTYGFTDQGLQNGLYYYRLKFAENGGTYTYSQIKMVRIGNERPALFPNPAKDHLTITYPFKPGTRLKVMNTLGELVSDKTFYHEQSFLRLDISKYRPGVYYLVIDGDATQFFIQ